MDFEKESSTKLAQSSIKLDEDFSQFKCVMTFHHQFKEEEEDNDGQQTDLKEEDKLTLSSSSIQISKAILGSTILCLPSVFHNVGIVFGLLFLLFNSVIAYFVVDILLKCKDITRKYGFSIYGKITMGSYGTVLVKSVISINNLGMCCCYFKILGELCCTLCAVFLLNNTKDHMFLRTTVYIILSFFLLIPFIVKDNAKLLSKASIIGIIGVLIFFVCVVLIFLLKLRVGQIITFKSSLLWPKGSMLNFFSSLPALFLAFSFHFTVFPLYTALKDKNNTTMLKSSRISILFSYGVYSLTALLGYLMYPDSICDLITINFKKDLIKYLVEDRLFICFLLAVVIIAFIVSLLLTIPLVFNGTKKHVLNLVLFTKKKYRKLFLGFGGLKIKTNEGIMITLVLYTIVLVITLSVDNVMILFNFVGSTTASAISFILPAIFLLQLLNMNGIKEGRILAIFVLIVGIFALFSFYITEIVKFFMY